MGYTDIIGEAQVADQMIPDQEVNQILQEAAHGSVMMSNARIVRMTARKYKQPVLATLPDAYWVDSETGLKQTTSASWEGLTMTAEELAVIVPIPDTLISDSSVPLWNEIRPLIIEAMGRKIDQACIFGVDKPDTWADSILDSATAAGNTVTRSDDEDLGENVSTLGAKIAAQGYGVNGFISKPGMQWELVGLRDKNGAPIYTALAGDTNQGLYGYAFNEVMNGSWDSEKAELIALDWTKQLIGVRQDVTFDVFSEGVISDADGKIVLNLMQQDTKALRIVFRVGYQVAAPVTRVQTEGEKVYPGGIVLPGASA